MESSKQSAELAAVFADTSSSARCSVFGPVLTRRANPATRRLAGTSDSSTASPATTATIAAHGSWNFSTARHAATSFSAGTTRLIQILASGSCSPTRRTWRASRSGPGSGGTRPRTCCIGRSGTIHQSLTRTRVGIEVTTTSHFAGRSTSRTPASPRIRGRASPAGRSTSRSGGALIRWRFGSIRSTRCRSSARAAATTRSDRASATPSATSRTASEPAHRSGAWAWASRRPTRSSAISCFGTWETTANWCSSPTAASMPRSSQPDWRSLTTETLFVSCS